MNDPDKLAAMRLLNLLYSYAFWSADLRQFLIIYKSIRMSLKYGLCAMSGVSFVFYAGYLCLFGEIEKGNRYCDVALKIGERFYSKQWAARVHIIAYSMVKNWKFPTQDIVGKMSMAVKSSYESGDMEVRQRDRFLFGKKVLDEEFLHYFFYPVRNARGIT
jgi:predicted ATPase